MELGLVLEYPPELESSAFLRSNLQYAKCSLFFHSLTIWSVVEIFEEQIYFTVYTYKICHEFQSLIVRPTIYNSRFLGRLRRYSHKKQALGPDVDVIN